MKISNKRIHITASVSAAIVIFILFSVYLNVYGSSHAIADTASTTNNIGLKLTLYVSPSSILPGSTLNVTLTEYNTFQQTNAISASNHWALNSLLIWWPCTTSSPSPMYFAIFQGYYTITNISIAKPLPLTPPGETSLCPNRNISSFTFEPTSNLANVVYGAPAAHTAIITLKSTSLVTGYYSQTSRTSQGNPELNSFAAGTFTVAAGDEWGNLAIRSFVVG